MIKDPPCDVTLEFSTRSPLTEEQQALRAAIKRAVKEFGRGTAKASLRTYLIEAKHHQPALPPPTGGKSSKA